MYANGRLIRHGLTRCPVAEPARHLRTFLLICVHLRFNFLMPEPARNRRDGRQRDPRSHLVAANGRAVLNLAYLLT